MFILIFICAVLQVFGLIFLVFGRRIKVENLALN